MKKYYCDICGKELKEKEVIRVAPFGIDFTDYIRINKTNNELGIELDSCSECLPEFYEVFKKTLAEIKEKAIDKLQLSNGQ